MPQVGHARLGRMDLLRRRNGLGRWEGAIGHICTDAAPAQRVTQVMLLNDHQSAGCSK